MPRKKREPHPFFRSYTQTWYLQIGGRQINLGRDKTEAFRQYHELMANQQDITPSVPVVVLLEQYLAWTERRRSPLTYEWYERHIKPFAHFIGKRLTIAELRPHHVTSWIDARHAGSAANTVHGAIRAVQRAFNWAVKEGRIPKSPVASVEKPTPERRELAIDDDQFAAMLTKTTDDAERDLLNTLWETGCRVQEIRKVETRHVELEERRWVFPPSESKGKRVSRVVYLNDTAFEITKRLCETNPEGPIFRNGKGGPWTRNSIRCRFRKFGIKDLCGTVLRHSWITRALMSGVDPITVSVLAGHLNLHMVANRYSHLAKRPDFLRDQLGKLNDKAGDEQR